MYYRDINRIFGLFLYGLSGALMIPFILAVYYEYFADPLVHPQPHSTGAFLLTVVICLSTGALCHFFSKGATRHLFRKEGLVVVVLIWVLSPAFSSLPFILSGTLKNPFDAYFEAVSGLTTTGATTMQAKAYDSQDKEIPIRRTVAGPLVTEYVYYGTIEPVRDPVTHQILHEGVEAVSKALLFWRSFIQWLGGGGIVVLFVAILPIFGAGGRVLFQTEVAGPIKDALTPRIKETAIALWKIYLVLTVFQIALLLITNSQMEWLDATTIAFSALSTGGFSIRNASIGYYHNANTEWAVILCMLLGSINFSVYYFISIGKIFKIFKPEIILYFAIILFSAALAAKVLIGQPQQLLTGEPIAPFSFTEALRSGTFQIVSAISTTGFATANFDIWPYIVQALMLIVMFVGGMSGSTAGGIKIMRHYLLFRIAQHKVETLFHPKRIQSLKVANKEVDNSAIVMTLCFFLILISVSVAGTFIYILDGIDPQTSLSLVGCMINGTGLAFRAGNPLDSCAFLSNFGCLFSSILMIMGRLEFFAILALMVPAFWKKSE